MPGADRLWYIAEAMRQGLSEAEVYNLTKIDPWFLRNIREIVPLQARNEAGVSFEATKK